MSEPTPPEKTPWACWGRGDTAKAVLVLILGAYIVFQEGSKWLAPHHDVTGGTQLQGMMQTPAPMSRDRSEAGPQATFVGESSCGQPERDEEPARLASRPQGAPGPASSRNARASRPPGDLEAEADSRDVVGECTRKPSPPPGPPVRTAGDPAH